jgi:hypothetical protein
MNTLTLADLTLDYADAARLRVRRVEPTMLVEQVDDSRRPGMLDKWHSEPHPGIILDGVVGIRHGAPPGWHVLTPTEMGGPSYQQPIGTARHAIRNALVLLVRERLRYAETSAVGAMEPVRQRGPVLFRRLIEHAGIRMNLKHTAEGGFLLDDGVWVRPDLLQRGIWKVYERAPGRPGQADDRTPSDYTTNIRNAFVTGISLALRHRLESLDL